MKGCYNYQRFLPQDAACYRKILDDDTFSEPLNLLFYSFKKEHEAQSRKDRRHLDSFTSIDNISEKSTLTMDDEIIRKQIYAVLWSSIMHLDELSKRRLLAYFVEDLTYQQIAKLEGVSRTAVTKSINHSLNKIKKELNNFY